MGRGGGGVLTWEDVSDAREGYGWWTGHDEWIERRRGREREVLYNELQRENEKKKDGD